MCVGVVIGCAQPYGWKITSVEPNVEWLLSGGGSKGSHMRSLWPQHLAPDRSGVVWFSLRSLWPEQLVTETWSLHIRMVTQIQSVCPSTEMKFGTHLRCFEAGSIVFSGRYSAFCISLLLSCAKGPSWYHCVWFGEWALHWVIVTYQLLWMHWGALGNMDFHLNNSVMDQGLVWVIGGDRSCSQSIFVCGYDL